MAYGADSGPDFKAIADGAKKSPKFKAMTGGSDVAEDDGPSEAAHFGDAYAAAQAKDEEGFKASMLAGVKACLANYGPGK